MNTHDGAVSELHATIPSTASPREADQRQANIGFGGERRGSQSESWVVRNQLRIASLTRGEEPERPARPAGYRLVYSCALDTLDEMH